MRPRKSSTPGSGQVSAPGPRSARVPASTDDFDRLIGTDDPGPIQIGNVAPGPIQIGNVAPGPIQIGLIPPDLTGWQAVLDLVRQKRPSLAAVLEHAALLSFAPER